MLERERVLRGAYPLPREAVIAAFEGLLAIRHLHLEQDHLVRQALDVHRHGMDFAAALHLVRSDGCGAMISFDRRHVSRLVGQSKESIPGRVDGDGQAHQPAPDQPAQDPSSGSREEC